MVNEKRKAMLVELGKSFKNLGFEVEKNNKTFYIEHPQVYVKIWVDTFRGASKLGYGFRFKGIHSDNDYKNDVIYDDLNYLTLNGHYGSLDDFQFFLEDLPLDQISYWVERMVKQYIEPFKYDAIKALKAGRYEKGNAGKPYYIKYALFKDVALALNLPELAASYTRSSFGGDNCIGYEDLEGAFIEPKYIENKRGRQIVEERLKNKAAKQNENN